MYLKPSLKESKALLLLPREAFLEQKYHLRNNKYSKIKSFAMTE